MFKLFAITLALLLSGSQASVTMDFDIKTSGTAPEVLRRQADAECSSRYTVTLEARYSTQGNDLGMVPTHGRDTRVPSDDVRYQNFNDQPGHAAGTLQIGADYRDQPFRDNAAKQAFARSRSSVTALTEPSGTPQGFVRSNVYMHFGVCVTVKNTYGRWLEIMAETLADNQQICVSDWKNDNLADNPAQEACGFGNIYACRESPLEVQGTDGLTQLNSDVHFRFYCLDSCDDPDYEFYWRIVASQHPAERVGGKWVQPDAEDWCGERDGDDFPSSLLDPYPERYDAPSVFSLRSSSAATTVASVATLGALALLRALF